MSKPKRKLRCEKQFPNEPLMKHYEQKRDAEILRCKESPEFRNENRKRLKEFKTHLARFVEQNFSELSEEKRNWLKLNGSQISERLRSICPQDEEEVDMDEFFHRCIQLILAGTRKEKLRQKGISRDKAKNNLKKGFRRCADDMSSILFLYWHRIDKIPEIEAKKAGNNGEGDDYGDTNFAGEEYFTKYWASALLRKYETTTDYGPSIDVAQFFQNLFRRRQWSQRPDIKSPLAYNPFMELQDSLMMEIHESILKSFARMQLIYGKTKAVQRNNTHRPETLEKSEDTEGKSKRVQENDMEPEISDCHQVQEKQNEYSLYNDLLLRKEFYDEQLQEQYEPKLLTMHGQTSLTEIYDQKFQQQNNLQLFQPSFEDKFALPTEIYD